MLKQTENSKIMTFKLVSGEEIIAKVVTSTPNYITITRPLVMVMMPPEPDSDQGSVVFAPWMLGVEYDQTLQINTSNILTQSVTRTDVSEQYKLAIGDTSKKEIVSTPIMSRGRP